MNLLFKKLSNKAMLAGLCSSLVFPLGAIGGVIDFESLASGGVPTDNQEILVSEPFNVDGVAVSFGFDSNSDGKLDKKAVFEQVANIDKGKDTGFLYSGIADQAAPGFEAQLGNFFIRQFDPYKPFGVFTILYESALPVTAASGEIWDIDGHKNTEQFMVQAFDQQSLLATILSPLGKDKTLNGKPWVFGFNELSNISKIEITFVGSKKQGIGLAFNNFSPVQDISDSNQLSLTNIQKIPIFSTTLLMLIGLIAFFCNCYFQQKS